uniref:RNA helicase n=1 Tax=Meloidogyne floridensis TaxID=298350 RepID=A0A915NXT4_9BILA
MKVYKTFYILTIVFSIAACTNKQEGEPSSSKNAGKEQVEKTGKASKDKRPRFDELFKLISESFELVENEVKHDQKISDDEDQKVEHFIKINKDSEDSFEEKFIILLFEELFKARNIYKEGIIRHETLHSDIIKEIEKLKIIESLDSSEENIENYLNSEIYKLDEKIYLKLNNLVSYTRQDCLEFKEKYNEIEIKKSKERCENEGKICVNEFDRIIALNVALNPLCRFKSYWNPQDNERKKYLESVGTWTEQGMKSKSEKQLFEFNEKEVDAIYFDDANLIDVEIDKEVEPIEKFSDLKLDLDPWLKDNMDLCNFKRPTPIQKYVLPALIRGNKSFDLIGVAETGSGKLAIFKINLVETGEHNKLHYTPSALILSPTMELTIQLYKEVLKLTYRTPIVPAYAGCHILIATPLRLLEMMVNKDIFMIKCNFLVIDEIDQMLDNGFIPQIRKIEGKLPDKIQRITVMFSATFEEKLKQLASSFLRDNYIKVKITRNIPPYLKHQVLWVDDFDKDEKLKE